MRTEPRAMLGVLLLTLAACQSGTPASGIQNASIPPKAALEPASCAADEVAVLSCKLASSDRIASLCALPLSDGRWNFRFAYGAHGAPLIARFPANGVDHGNGFTRSRLMLVDGAGGFVYSTIVEGQRYSLYSIQGKGFSDAGLQISLPGAAKAISEDTCLQETVIQSHDETLLEALRRWKSDPSFQDKGMPTVDEMNK